MSAPQSLPDRPNLNQLKIQAKELLRSHKAGEMAAAERLRAALPEYADAADEAILSARFSLLDAQRAVASEYGFATWGELQRHIDQVNNGTFEDLFQYERGTTYLIAHEVEVRDLAVALHGLTDAERDQFLFNMPDPMRSEFDAAESGSAPSAEQIDAARRRILTEVERLADEGQLAWPPWAQRKPHREGATNRASTDLEGKLRDSTVRRLAECDYEQIDEMMANLGQLARLMGILHLKPLVPDVGDPFLQTGLKMALDGTEPERVTETLEHMMRTLLHEQEVRYRKVIAGMRSVQKGDNPAYVKETLELIR